MKTPRPQHNETKKDFLIRGELELKNQGIKSCLITVYLISIYDKKTEIANSIRQKIESENQIIRK